MKYCRRSFFTCLFLFLASMSVYSQPGKRSANNTPVYVDKNGVIRWKHNNSEASFFGVNYTTPFAFAYRAHKALNVDIETAIRHDVYHFSRLGLDAFRVHVWDTEISDSSGNLLENEHLRLYDFLLAELKKRNIKTIITPIAFWGNGYPERDERTPGFSRVYGKARATTNDTAIRAQENFIRQFFRHVNPYTKLTYGDDPDIIAAEINNEPSHSGPKSSVTAYINRLTAALKSTRWAKPVFYNISQNPSYADAVAASAVNGFSFQWYPTGLVAGHTLKGNYLPNVDKYTIPFDTIPAYKRKALMVYEFDAADIFQSNMYPAMARSFREAGFQWATQFSYDPMAIAGVNTEYQTHYLNLAYTPSKAISLLIASKAFHKLPRLKNYGIYPQDSVFDAFRLSYKEDLSEMNTEQEFYYSNSTSNQPLRITTLQHLAGVGSSPVVQYTGTGAYFLDRIEEGVWRLEVMPDAIHIRDPFERASPWKEVTAIYWGNHPIKIMLPELGRHFHIKGLNEGNPFSATAAADSFNVTPGAYLLSSVGKQLSAGKGQVGVIGLHEYAAPKPVNREMIFKHIPYTEVSPGKPFFITATVAGIDTGTVSVQVNRLGAGGQGRLIRMTRRSGLEYTAEIPQDLLAPGILNYRIIIQRGNVYTVYPGNKKGNPFAWDYYEYETWQSRVAAENAALEIYNPVSDQAAVIYPSFRRNFQSGYITGERPGQLILKLNASELSGDHTIGITHYFADKLDGRKEELSSFGNFYLRARTGNQEPVKAKLILRDKHARAYSTSIFLTNRFEDIEVPLTNLQRDSALILPRPYPGFLPLWFKGSAGEGTFSLAEAENISILIGSDLPSSELKKPYSLELQSIWLGKKRE